MQRDGVPLTVIMEGPEMDLALRADSERSDVAGGHQLRSGLLRSPHDEFVRHQRVAAVGRARGFVMRVAVAEPAAIARNTYTTDTW